MELALSVAEECIDPTELRNLLDKKPNPIAYDGFEPSGRMHIAQVTALRPAKSRFTLITTAQCFRLHSVSVTGLSVADSPQP